MSMTEPGTGERLSVLVADDDPVFGALARSTLTREGFDVHFARDGGEALGALSTGEFALALVDLSMPRIDGFRLIALVRSTPRLRHLPIIVLSSRTDVGAVEEAYALGADAYQSKPVNWALLPTHVRHVHRGARAMAELRDELAAVNRSAVDPGLPGPRLPMTDGSFAG